MTVYVDALLHRGWQMHGREIPKCRMFSDAEDPEELHAVAQVIGLRRAWFKNRGLTPYYELTPGKRAEAIEAGAVPIGRSLAARICRAQAARSPRERGA